MQFLMYISLGLWFVRMPTSFYTTDDQEGTEAIFLPFIFSSAEHCKFMIARQTQTNHTGLSAACLRG